MVVALLQQNHYKCVFHTFHIHTSHNHISSGYFHMYYALRENQNKKINPIRAGDMTKRLLITWCDSHLNVAK